MALCFQLDVNSFIQLQEAVQPDWYECLCDSDTNKDSSKKRIAKSVDRTLTYLDQVLERHSKSEVNLQYRYFPTGKPD